jgi:hypothetical protein
MKDSYGCGSKPEGIVEELVLWRRLDQPGHEAARIVFHNPFWQLAGSAVFAHDGQPCHLEYLVVCDATWKTSHARVTGWVGERRVRYELWADGERRWRVNGTAQPEVTGCIDLDLAFSPLTNLIPIRRLGLALGEEREVRAAWLAFPDFALEPLMQVYRRSGEATYRYEALGGGFVTELEVDAAGLITRYPGRWEMESVHCQNVAEHSPRR